VLNPPHSMSRWYPQTCPVIVSHETTQRRFFFFFSTPIEFIFPFFSLCVGWQRNVKLPALSGRPRPYCSLHNGAQPKNRKK
jgi:hypothetical protein